MKFTWLKNLFCAVDFDLNNIEHLTSTLKTCEEEENLEILDFMYEESARMSLN